MKKLSRFLMILCLGLIGYIPQSKAIPHYWWCDGQSDLAINEDLVEWETYRYLDCGTIRLMEKYNYDPKPEYLFELYNSEVDIKIKFKRKIALINSDLREAEKKIENIKHKLKSKNLSNTERKRLNLLKADLSKEVDELEQKSKGIRRSQKFRQNVDLLKVTEALISAWKELEDYCYEHGGNPVGSTVDRCKQL